MDQRVDPGWQFYRLPGCIALKIALKFLDFTYELPAELVASHTFLNEPLIHLMLISLAGLVMLQYLFSKFCYSRPALAYFAIITAGAISTQCVLVPMLHVEDVTHSVALPVPHFDSPLTWAYVFGFGTMLAIDDVIEQVMSNAVIQEIDPLKRECKSNNRLLAIWIANVGASFIGGMTNLDGLEKNTTNRLAGAYTKRSVFIVECVVTFFVRCQQYLECLRSLRSRSL